MRGPFIVKPVVACGVSHSHSMALVLQPAALASLQGQLPLPALVQEFVNHGGTQFKVYVLGDKVRELR
jgi:inositol-1,3,4-trisphosphate 5/6-kinase/inositol-tetrakisphosphate 1-kinase